MRREETCSTLSSATTAAEEHTTEQTHYGREMQVVNLVPQSAKYNGKESTILGGTGLLKVVIQWNLRTRDTSRLILLSLVERLSLSQR